MAEVVRKWTIEDGEVRARVDKTYEDGTEIVWPVPRASCEGPGYYHRSFLQCLPGTTSSSRCYLFINNFVVKAT